MKKGGPSSIREAAERLTTKKRRDNDCGMDEFVAELK